MATYTHAKACRREELDLWYGAPVECYRDEQKKAIVYRSPDCPMSSIAEIEIPLGFELKSLFDMEVACMVAAALLRHNPRFPGISKEQVDLLKHTTIVA